MIAHAAPAAPPTPPGKPPKPPSPPPYPPRSRWRHLAARAAGAVLEAAARAAGAWCCTRGWHDPRPVSFNEGDNDEGTVMICRRCGATELLEPPGPPR